jgi:hypothetical protein
MVIETLPFESTQQIEAPGLTSPAPSTGPPKFSIPLVWDRRSMIAAGVLVLLIGGFLVLRRKKPAAASRPADLHAVAAASASPSLPAAPAENQIASQLAEHDAQQRKLDDDALHSPN